MNTFRMTIVTFLLTKKIRVTLFVCLYSFSIIHKLTHLKKKRPENKVLILEQKYINLPYQPLKAHIF